MKDRKLIAALAVRNQGSRLYGKPLQNLDVESGTTVLANILACLRSVDCIDEIGLGIANGQENTVFTKYAEDENIPFIVGDEIDVLGRLIACGRKTNGTDIFRVTSESPFPSYDFVQEAWNQHVLGDADATFFDDVVDGCGFEIIRLDALKEAHKNGEDRHRSELCSLYIRENIQKYKVAKLESPSGFNRKDLRLTVDNPEDLIVCKAVYKNFIDLAPRIPLQKIISFLDMNKELSQLTQPFTESGYDSMYLWSEDE
jgi:spore coat polysaccharide biosynthesis protein SpsF